MRIGQMKLMAVASARASERRPVRKRMEAHEDQDVRGRSCRRGRFARKTPVTLAPDHDRVLVSATTTQERIQNVWIGSSVATSMLGGGIREGEDEPGADDEGDSHPGAFDPRRVLAQS